MKMGGLLSFFSSSPAPLDDWLDGRVVWITGASSGLGRALAIEAARRGARVALSARDVGKLEEVSRECLAVAPPPPPPPSPSSSQGHGQGQRVRVLVRRLDMAAFDGPEFAGAAAEVTRALGGLDLLINNAGVSTRSSAKETALSVDVSVMGTNFFGPMALTKAALPHLRQVSSGLLSV